MSNLLKDVIIIKFYEFKNIVLNIYEEKIDRIIRKKW